MNAPIVLSIDWDFFLWRGSEASEPKTIACVRDGEKHDVPAWMLFDWGHSETHAVALQELLWATRHHAFETNGLDPKEICGYRGLEPHGFIGQAAPRFDVGAARLFLSDSHKEGFLVVQEAFDRFGSVEVVHFDAHHDLGYGGVEHQIEKGLADCGSWLFHAMRLGMVERVTVVYPDWRDRGQENLGLEHLKPFRKRIRGTSWSRWLRMRWRRRDVVAITLARSGSWTPPWFDGDYLGFVRQLQALQRRPGGVLPGGDTVCLDCRLGSPFDACTARTMGRAVIRSERHGNQTESV